MCRYSISYKISRSFIHWWTGRKKLWQTRDLSIYKIFHILHESQKRLFRPLSLCAYFILRFFLLQLQYIPYPYINHCALQEKYTTKHACLKTEQKKLLSVLLYIYRKVNISYYFCDLTRHSFEYFVKMFASKKTSVFSFFSFECTTL